MIRKISLLLSLGILFGCSGVPVQVDQNLGKIVFLKLRRKTTSLSKCYFLEKIKNKKFGGVFETSFTISKEGSVQDFSMTDNNIFSLEGKECIRDIFSSMNFKSLKNNEPLYVHQPLNFRFFKKK